MRTDTSYSYHYTGPEKWHAVVGQIMAYLGYAGGHEPRPLGAEIALREERGGFILRCSFRREDKHWQAEAFLLPQRADGSGLKAVLLHWHGRFLNRPLSPWGTLLGVRPTKLLHHLWDLGYSGDAIRQKLQETYHVQPGLADSLLRMVRLQRPYIERPGTEAALYIGIPYCPSHCLYCSFPSRLVGTEKAPFLHRFADAVVQDLEDIAGCCARYGLAVTSVYIGGGTPTCLPQADLERILRTVHDHFLPVREWTVEAGRPDTASPAVLRLLRSYGVDRISVNPQTMQQHLLDLLGRRHRVEDIYEMYDNCQKTGFPVINMDFIAGLPEQTEADMQENMEIVCQLHPENVTIHTLALKRKAPLFQHPLRQRIPGEQQVARFLSLCRKTLAEAGYLPYYMYRQTYMAGSFANVGYALPGTISAYNIQMMEERQTILAAGPGGATKFCAADGHSLKKVYMPKDPAQYLSDLPEKMRQRRQLCAMIYGGDDT